MNLKEKLGTISSDERSNWVRTAQEKMAKAETRKITRKVALRVLHILKQRGIKQIELAAWMGVAPQKVTRIVKGEDRLREETIRGLERALRVSLKKLVKPNGAGSGKAKRRRYTGIRKKREKGRSKE